MRKYPSIIKFVLDDAIHEVDFLNTGFKPTTTVLNYLRSLPNHKGVKEGCAEGDCGACTIVVASLNNRGALEYKSVASCLVFLPMVHGKQLITVENLAQKKDSEKILHPVQAALINNDGSQCGYCTPGIAMSLFALYKNHEAPDKATITSGLTGNLCRCTGYRPIIDAAFEMFKTGNHDHFTENETNIISLLRSGMTTRCTYLFHPGGTFCRCQDSRGPPGGPSIPVQWAGIRWFFHFPSAAQGQWDDGLYYSLRTQ